MTYIIAELGQNHNGDIDTAYNMIEKASKSQVNAIKLTMRDLDNEMTDDMANSPYNSPNSYGKTYMDHRKKLELDPVDINNLCIRAKDLGVDVVITLCSSTLLNKRIIREHIIPKCEYIKIASRDITNIPLLEGIKPLDKKIIISTGMCDFFELTEALKILYKKDVTIMHCVSKYPTEDSDARLIRINTLKNQYGIRYRIGYSDHTMGIDAVKIAVCMGATVIEKHMTLDPEDKGSDHKGSLTPVKFRYMRRQVNYIQEMIGLDHSLSAIDGDGIKGSRIKLMRSICANRNIRKGEVFTEDNLCLLSPGDGIPGNYYRNLIGKTCNSDINAKTAIKMENIK